MMHNLNIIMTNYETDQNGGTVYKITGQYSSKVSMRTNLKDKKTNRLRNFHRLKEAKKICN